MGLIDWDEVVASSQPKSPQQPQQSQNVFSRFGRNALSTIGDVLSRPNYASANIAKALVDNKRDSIRDVLRAGARGLRGQDRTTYRDVLETAGVGELGSVRGRVFGKDIRLTGRGALGFAGDVLLDPLTYVSLGSSAGAKIGVKGAAKTLNREGTQQFARMSRNLGREHAERVMSNIVANNPQMATRFLDQGGVKFAGRTIPGTAPLVNPAIDRVRSLTSRVGRDASIAHNLPFQRTQQAFRDRLDAGISRYTNLYQKQFRGLSRKDRELITRALDEPAKYSVPVHLKRAHDFAKRELDDIRQQEQARGILREARENYVTHLYQDPQAARRLALYVNTKQPSTRFAKERSITHIREAEELGLKPVLDIEEVLRARRASSQRAVQKSDFLRETARTQGVPEKVTRQVQETIPENVAFNQRLEQNRMRGTSNPQQGGFVRPLGAGAFESVPRMPVQALSGQVAQPLPTTRTVSQQVDNPALANAVEPLVVVPGVRELQGVRVPSSVGSYIEQLDQQVIRSESLSATLRAYDTALNFWKASITSLFPSFHFRNAMSNVVQNYLDIGFVQAVRPKFHIMAVKVLRGGVKGETIKLGEQVYKISELRRLMEDSGIFTGVGYFDVKGPVNRYNVGRRVGRSIENEARGVSFLANLELLGDPITAAERTKKYLFDYDNLSDVEKHFLRRVFPFYTWTAKNIALQSEVLLTNPGKIANQIKLFRSPTGAPEVNAQLPEYLQGRMTIGANTDNPNELDVSSGFGLPIEAASEFYSNPIRAITSASTPALKVPFELATGKEIFRDKPINEITNASDLSWLPQFAKDLIDYDEREAETKDGRTYTRRTANPMALYISRQLPTSRLFNTVGDATDQEQSLGERLLAIATGIRSRTVNLETEAYFREKEAKEALLQPFIQRGIVKDGQYGYYIPKNVSMAPDERSAAQQAISLAQPQGGGSQKISKKEAQLILLADMLRAEGISEEHKRQLDSAIYYTALGKKVPKGRSGRRARIRKPKAPKVTKVRIKKTRIRRPKTKKVRLAGPR